LLGDKRLALGMCLVPDMEVSDEVPVCLRTDLELAACVATTADGDGDDVSSPNLLPETRFNQAGDLPLVAQIACNLSRHNAVCSILI
jgi:hypothetical protein